MRIIVADYSGFCSGVRRAVDLAKAALAEDKAVYVLGDLVHNDDVMSELRQRGLKVITIEDLAPQSTLLIRAHGTTPDVYTKAKQRKCSIIDATCPCVQRIHRVVTEMVRDGLRVVVFGEKDHPEVLGIVSRAGDDAIVVESADEALSLPDNLPPLGLVAQTTANHREWQKVAEILQRKAASIHIVDTICNATTQRQQAAIDLAQQVDIMLIVGGHNSANTTRLWALCCEIGVPAYHIANAGEIVPSWFKLSDTVGITAGASTPDWIIKEVLRRMEKIEKQLEVNQEDVVSESTEEATSSEPTVEETPVEEQTQPEVDTETEDLQAAVEDEEMTELRRNSLVTGEVVRVDEDEVFVDIGYKTEGIVSLRELTNDPTLTPADVVSVGDKIDVVVLRTADENGNPVLSKRRADSRKAWAAVKKAFADHEIVSGKVLEEVKGGLIVDVFGLRGFMPASLVDRRYVPELSVFVGQEVQAYIIELDQAKRRIVLSRQAVLEETYEKQRQETWESLEEGQVRTGVVQRLTDFGAFVDLGGVDGLIHISELSWGRVDHPSDVLSEGQEVQVRVLNVDRERERVSLSLRATLPDPWDTVEEKYPPGSIVQGKVVRTASFGAFVELEPGVEGLVHISQLAWRHVENTEEVVKPGDEVEVKVLSVSPDEKRISLSIKETQERPQRGRPQQTVTHTERGSITLGDMFGDLLNKAKGKKDKDKEDQ